MKNKKLLQNILDINSYKIGIVKVYVKSFTTQFLLQIYIFSQDYNYETLKLYFENSELLNIYSFEENIANKIPIHCISCFINQSNKELYKIIKNKSHSELIEYLKTKLKVTYVGIP